MNLSQALRITSSSPIIAFVGAGGKTTALFQLAHELIQPSSLRLRSGRAIVTATTHLGAWQIPLADHHIIAESVDDVIDHEFHGITLITGAMENDRAKPIDISILLRLYEESKRYGIPLLIEADGSRQKPLKAPAEHEPAIPEFVELVVVVAGLSGLGKPLNENHVHRPELFGELANRKNDTKIMPEDVVKVLCHPKGGLKNIPSQARRAVLLNQADTPELQAVGGRMAGGLLKDYDSVLVGTLQSSNLQVFENVAGIILAAGGSKRFGGTKQLLNWHGQPFVRAVAKTALDAGLSPVLVVTGANADEVEKVVNDLDVSIVRNDDWQSGQSSSIRAGVQALPPKTGACVFLLADQPQIPASVIHALMDVHANGLHPIVAPLVRMEHRANPVLFDRVTFPDLLALEGDVGGRAIFSKHKVEFMPWHNDILLLDVDKPEDYKRLVESE
ncbi:MAG: selenium cofactor biosynthesis protein YqeC [Anaerolineales bacterium]|nr:selenium cofactor biosynthesis protein YqeC [Anaerolineales bacterium]